MCIGEKLLTSRVQTSTPSVQLILTFTKRNLVCYSKATRGRQNIELINQSRRKSPAHRIGSTCKSPPSWRRLNSTECQQNLCPTRCMFPQPRHDKHVKLSPRLWRCKEQFLPILASLRTLRWEELHSNSRHYRRHLHCHRRIKQSTTTLSTLRRDRNPKLLPLL